jgi:hypothetical protein
VKVGDLVRHEQGYTGLVLEDGGIRMSRQYYLIQWVDWYHLPQANQQTWMDAAMIFEVISESR